MISIVIATKNRPRRIIPCVKSLLKNLFQDFEIIVIDQSINQQTQKTMRLLESNMVTYIHHPSRGKSRALNKGILSSQGDIIAFTDDDCIVSPQWLSTIQKSFTDNPNISVVFGKTLPYQPNHHKGQTCPCTFINKHKKIITKPCLHYKHIGFGNNMTIRRSSLDRICGFKNWLGPGSIGSNAEDAEFALRTLLKGHKILYDPSITVYHNKWLTPQEMKTQHLSYACGEMACYGYFYFQGHAFARTVVLQNIHDSFHKTKRLLKKMLLLRWDKILLTETYDTVSEMFWRGRGLFIGFVYAWIDPIQ